MKKMFALLLLTLFSSTLFAAFQYEVVTTPHLNENLQGYGGNYYTVNITSGTGDIYIVDRINNLSSMPGNNQVLDRVMSDYGYINPQTGDYIQGTWETIVTNQYQKNQWNDLVYQTAYKVGTFSEGESIGVWIDNKSGERNTSVLTEFTKHGSYGLDGTDKFGTIMAELDYNSSSAIFFGFHGVENTFGGQPLPGMLATFLLGGSALGAAGLKRKKKRF